MPTSESSRRRPGWVLLGIVFVILPLAAVLGENAFFFNVFGNGSTIPLESVGAGLLEWWERIGRELTVGLAACVVLLIGRVRPIRAALLGATAGVLTFAWFVAVLFVALACAGPNALG